MKYQISCPFCGRKIIKAEFCTKVEVQCTHCKETIIQCSTLLKDFLRNINKSKITIINKKHTFSKLNKVKEQETRLPKRVR